MAHLSSVQNLKSHKAHGLKMRRSLGAESTELNLTSMIDMFTIILIFLIKSYSVSDVALSPDSTIQMPYSTATEIPTIAVKVSMSQENISIDGRPIINLQNGRLQAEDVQGLVIFPLYRELKAIAVLKAEEEKQDPNREFKRQVLLYGDKRIPYGTLKRILFTAGQAEYETFRLSVIRKGRDKGA
jgi:biopolymer transport protein ExbD